MQGYAQEGQFGVRNKKPFCNAFTGCGRKRADPEVAEEELIGLLAERIQGIRDQVVVRHDGYNKDLALETRCLALGIKSMFLENQEMISPVSDMTFWIK